MYFKLNKNHLIFSNNLRMKKNFALSANSLIMKDLVRESRGNRVGEKPNEKKEYRDVVILSTKSLTKSYPL